MYVEQAFRNVVAFCDEIHAFDHVSTDGTWDILQRLASEIDHLHVRRTHHAGDSHTFIEQYAGTDTWVFGVDGDELYDPHRLAALRQELLAGAYDGVFKVAANVVNCVELSRAPATATGYPSPPSRSITKLYNFAAIESWAGDGSERLHGGTISFRPGFDEGSVDNIGERLSWDETPLRCLHLCFVRRSTADPDDPVRPPNPDGERHARSHDARRASNGACYAVSRRAGRRGSRRSTCAGASSPSRRARFSAEGELLVGVAARSSRPRES